MITPEYEDPDTILPIKKSVGLTDVIKAIEEAKTTMILKVYPS
jgi:hypothetical protein